MATPRLLHITVIDGPAQVFNKGRYPKIYMPVNCAYDPKPVMVPPEKTSGDCENEYVNNSRGCMSYAQSGGNNGTYNKNTTQQQQGYRCDWDTTAYFLRLQDLPVQVAKIFENIDYNNFYELWERMNSDTELHMIQIVHQIMRCCMTGAQLQHLLNM